MLCNPLPPPGKDPRLPQIITVSFVEGNLLSEDTGLVTPLLSFLPAVRSIRTLTADSLPLRFLREWESLSERLPDVVSINVSGVSAHGLAMALNADGALFSHLATLSVENVSFTGSVDVQLRTLADIRRLSGLWDSAPASDAEEESEMETTSEEKMASPWVASVSLFEVLLKGLRARDAASLPVDKISIRKCDVTAGMVAQLRALLGADCVESDGKEDVGPRPQM
ncbi:hypothetical protein BV25DRAFT_1918996 [Artomyces pyxidatus]|uniref:Uncharacterized protein n=1 Tax=Artomyces pyxidatus TaxID=48021 RepID=A0ACB8SQW8_9AGAM|nr:hypothetical protein BV25DRAFT_1918996 [Artomyces pyxidatus]